MSTQKPAEPYRVPPPIEPDPPPNFGTRLARLGPRVSVHTPLPVGRVVAIPIVLAGVVLVSAGLNNPSPYGIGLMALLLAALAVKVWKGLRDRDCSVALHARGLLVSRGGARADGHAQAVIEFDDVNEVWFEIAWLKTGSGAHLRALRLLDFSGGTHRLPLAVLGAQQLVSAVLAGCSVPLFAEAKAALLGGATLTFGQIQLDRRGITAAGSRAEWREIRLAVVRRGKIFLYRRAPFFAWKTIDLGDLPNPTVFISLVTERAMKARVDDRFIVLDATLLSGRDE
ncbi:MAG: DUF6585 family protein [Polyangiaceae bacterium]